MMIAAPKESEPTRRRTLIYVCVTCGHEDIDHVEVKLEDTPPNERIRLIRCASCTRKGLALPPREKSRTSDQP